MKDFYVYGIAATLFILLTVLVVIPAQEKAYSEAICNVSIDFVKYNKTIDKCQRIYCLENCDYEPLNITVIIG